MNSGESVSKAEPVAPHPDISHPLPDDNTRRAELDERAGDKGEASSSAPSSRLEKLEEDLIGESLHQIKADIGEGEPISDVREAVEADFSVYSEPEKLNLIDQLRGEIEAPNKDAPVTKSSLNEIKDFESKVQDGRGGGHPKDCAPKDQEGIVRTFGEKGPPRIRRKDLSLFGRFRHKGRAGQ